MVCKLDGSRDLSKAGHMDTLAVIEDFGIAPTLALGGAAIGFLFGFMGQRSGFCLRSAVIEFWRRQSGEKLPVWLLSFATAVVLVQAVCLSGMLDIDATRQLVSRGTLSGALVGGLCFGVGMILTRGCASRLLILAAGGNLRALLSGLIFAVSAQAALGGALSPLRLAISEWSVVEGGTSRNVLSLLGGGHTLGLVIGAVWLVAAVFYATRHSIGLGKWAGGIGVGVAVAAAWTYTAWIAKNAFDVVPIEGITFSGPSADWLMRVVTRPGPPMDFNWGMLPAVFVGAFAGARLSGQWKLEGFKDGYSMRRYIAGAILMGFGAMLGGGCAVGAGLSGGSIFSLTAWTVLVGMWIGGGLADRWIDQAGVQALPTP